MVGVSVVLLGGCSGSPQVQSAPAVRAVVDEVRGTVRLPLDDYRPTFADYDVSAYALEIKTAACVKAHGFGYRPIDRAGHSQAATSYGVWSLAQARRYGYAPVPDPVSDALQARVASTSTAQDQIVQQCMTMPQMRDVKVAWASELATLKFLRYDRPIDTGPGQAVLEEWRACLEDAGITPPGQPQKLTEYVWTPPGVEGMSAEQKLTTAVADVTCKRKVNLVQRLADLEAGTQEQIIAAHGPELVAYRDLWRARLATAQKVIDGYHGA